MSDTLRERLTAWLAQAPAELLHLRVSAEVAAEDAVQALQGDDRLHVVGATAVCSRAEEIGAASVQLLHTRPATREDLRRVAEEQLAEAAQKAGL